MYGPPIPTLRADFWESLTTIGIAFFRPWCLIGDFNALLNQEDKLGGRSVTSSSNSSFQKFINDLGLIDVGFLDHPYTWSNHRSEAAHIQERLDRSFANATWRLQFPHAVVTHLTAIHSDHRHLLFNSNPISHSFPKPFRFEAMWLDHPNTSRIIHIAWAKGFSLLSKFKNTKTALKAWNKNIFSNLQHKIKQLH